MKKLTYRSDSLSVILISTMLLTFLFQACNDGLKEDHDDLDPTSAPIVAPMAISFIDAHPLERKNINNVKVTIIDPQGQVLSANGVPITTTINIKEGIMTLGLRPGYRFERTRPYRFFIKSEADNYTPMMSTIILNNDRTRHYTIFMASMKNPPPGFASFSAQVPVGPDGVIQEGIELSSPQNDQLEQGLNLLIREGTVLYAGEEPLTGFEGNIDVNISFGSPVTVDAMRVFPNGTRVTDAIDDHGEVIATPSNPFDFYSAGWTTINMTAGEKEITNFSKPLSLEMEINPALLNPSTNEPLASGTKIPTWSLNDETGVWFQEGETTLDDNGGNLKARFPINHLSTWNFDFKGDDRCTEAFFIRVSNPDDDEHFSELVSEFTGLPLLSNFGTERGESINYDGIEAPAVAGDGGNGEESIRIINAPVDSRIAFVIYESSTGPGTVLAASNAFETCDDDEIPVALPSEEPADCVTFEALIRFSNGDATVDQPLCSNALWYKTCNGTSSSCAEGESCNHDNDNCNCSAPYEYAGAFDSSNTLTTTGTGITGGYCFRVWYMTDDGPNDVRFRISFIDGHQIDFTNDTLIGVTSTSTGSCGTHHRITINGGHEDFLGTLYDFPETCPGS